VTRIQIASKHVNEVVLLYRAFLGWDLKGKSPVGGRIWRPLTPTAGTQTQVTRCGQEPNREPLLA
ncbi:MAG: hypothetical protein ACYS76_08175, partial [Planctomycetota bacterium]